MVDIYYSICLSIFKGRLSCLLSNYTPWMQLLLHGGTIRSKWYNPMLDKKEFYIYIHIYIYTNFTYVYVNYMYMVCIHTHTHTYAGGKGDDRGWDGWMAPPTQWTWIWVDSGSWWWTGKPGELWSMGSQRVGHSWATELNWYIHEKLWPT